jgi:hypothetical protein
MDFLSSYNRSLLSIFLTIALFSSFGLHAVQIQHEHFGTTQVHTEENHGTHPHGEHQASGFGQLDIAMHLADKKLLLFLLFAGMVLIPFLNTQRILAGMLQSALRHTRTRQARYGNTGRIHAYLTHCFRKGIFHSKAF